jgi:hypothetical protein
MRRKSAVKCPTCKRDGDWFGGSYGPFCSRRCKLVDLGKWFDEEHAISQPLQTQDSDQMPENSDPRRISSPKDETSR